MNKITKLASAVGVALSIAAGNALATLPTDVTGAFTSLETDAGTLMTAVWGVVTVVVLGFVYIKLFKKGVGKAT